jgi:ABC-type nitrate/sulfonate/bicarbonate transport system permease component
MDGAVSIGMTVVDEVYGPSQPTKSRWRRDGRQQRGVWLWRLAVPPIGIGVWQLAYHFKLSSRALLPSPHQVWDATVSLHRSGRLWSSLWSTLEAAGEALLLAAVIGIPVGVLFGMLPRTWAVLSPYLNALNSMPRIAFAPVFIVVFGIGQNAKVALGFSIAVFIFMMNSRIGVLSADDEHRKLCLMLGASRFQLFRKLYMPVAVPAIFTALRLGMVYALLGVISSEILASKAGVGQLIASYSGTLSMAYVYSLLIILAAFASILTIVVGALESVFLRWQRAGIQS